MEPKVSAKELMNIVTDTNKKVSVMAGLQHAKTRVEKYSTFGAIMAILYLVLGVALLVSVIFQHITGTAITLFFEKVVWDYIYVGFALFAIFIMSIARIHPAIRFFTLLSAIAPLCISFIVNVI